MVDSCSCAFALRVLISLSFAASWARRAATMLVSRLVGARSVGWVVGDTGRSPQRGRDVCRRFCVGRRRAATVVMLMAALVLRRCLMAFSMARRLSLVTAARWLA